jgi:diguanylate cyclase (GGDEF)-like protein
MLVRYGGEEFVVLLPEVPGPGAVVVAGRIRRAVAGEPVEAAGTTFPLTVSLGVAARLDEGPESIDELLERAGSALELAKERGRNRVVALSLGRSIAA